MSYYILIRGPLGIGKSTISQELAKRLNAEYISMDSILEEHGLARTDSDYTADDFLKANEIIIPHVKKLLAKGKIVIFDGNFYFKEQIDHLIKNVNAVHFVFTLKATLETCIERDKNRKQECGEEAAKAVYGLVSKFDYGTVIDTEGKSKEEIVKNMLSYVLKTSKK